MKSILKYIILFVCLSLASCAALKKGGGTSSDSKAGDKKEGVVSPKPLKVTARSLYQQNQRLIRQNTDLMRRVVKLQEQMKEDRQSYEKKLTRMDRTIALMEKHMTVMQKNQLKMKTKLPASSQTPKKVQIQKTPKKSIKKQKDTLSEKSTNPKGVALNEISTPKKSGAIESFSFSPVSKPQPQKREKTIFQTIPIDTREAEENEVSGWEDPDLNKPVAPLKLKVRAGAKRYYNRAFKKYAEKNYTASIKAFKNFISKFPNDQDADNAQFWIGFANFHLENYRQSEFEFRKVLRNYQHRETKHGYKTPDTILMLGRLYLKKEKPIKARYYFEKLVEKFPDTRSALKAKMEVESMESF